MCCKCEELRFEMFCVVCVGGFAPCAHDPDRLSKYVDYENSLNLIGLTFPLAVKDVPKFERQNTSISVSVLCLGDQGGFMPLHVSKERDRPKHVNLFLIEGKTKANTTYG